MPSVRIRRKHAYTSLRDQVASESAAASQAQAQRQRSASFLSASSLRPRSRSDALSSTGSPDYFPASNDPTDPSEFPSPRLSHVYRSVRHNSLSYRSGLPLSEQGSRPGLRDVFFEGRQSDLIVPDQSPHGRVGSALIAAAAGHDEENQFTAQDEDEDDHDSDSDSDSDEYSHHDDDVVEHLDVIDPQVATMSTLANAANAIMFPPVSLYSRKPVLVLPVTPHSGSAHSSADDLDRHVHHVLTKKDKFRRIMRGVWAFLKTPLGVVVGIYGVLVVFWGAAIVLFLLKWINLHNKDAQDQWIELSSQMCNTLFCITGLGLAPWRIIDTWRIYKIWWYKRRTKQLRRERGLPELYDSDDLPDPVYDPHYVHVLTDKEQADLHHQQKKFGKSQTWYRPHGTETHRAFPIGTALLICLLNFGNSFFQAMLTGCMWSLDRFERPAWTTGTLIPASFLCGVLSAVFISRGGQQTKRTERVEQCLRAALAREHELRHLDDDGDDGVHPVEGAAEKELTPSLRRAPGHKLEGSIPEENEPDPDVPTINGTQTSSEDGIARDKPTASADDLLDGRTSTRIDEEMFVPPRL
ncbi:hypothetical protein OF83DRAFT_1238597 [Amylostereum chailletii]|nr:hypothetical protein OF83DRAFT_1238597 [Amylostereum chailletii]